MHLTEYKHYSIYTYFHLAIVFIGICRQYTLSNLDFESVYCLSTYWPFPTPATSGPLVDKPKESTAKSWVISWYYTVIFVYEQLCNISKSTHLSSHLKLRKLVFVSQSTHLSSHLNLRKLVLAYEVVTR